MNSEMRLLKKPDTGGAASFKDVPYGLAYRPQVHATYDCFEEQSELPAIQ